jgi:hypothetical protein
MTAPREHEPATDWLFSLLRKWSGWAGTGWATGGCLNPLNLFKFIVFALLIVLCPLFMLPMVVVRLVKFGAGVRYSSTLDVASGDGARWGRGHLEPVADASRVTAELSAIASRDPGFRPDRLAAWANAATTLMCQSLTSGDPTPTRTFMANGLFRTHSALLELRAQGSVSCEGAWRAVAAAVVEAASTPLFDELRVRVRCEGWCWERHGATGLALRGGPDTRSWSEDLTFGRSAGALTPAAGGLPAGCCPSCGAPLSLDQNGTCRYCHGVVTAGRHDWVLTSWRREPW